MKTRSGFVSNSSSSSFIVIGTIPPDFSFKTLQEGYGNRDVLDVNPSLGCHQFGWENTEYTNIWDRVIFTWIQAAYMQKSVKKGGRPDWMKMLNKVMKKGFNVKQIAWNLSFDTVNGMYENCCYIDHQSAACEGANIEMFESEESLRNFIFAPTSYIQGGNDNG